MNHFTFNYDNSESCLENLIKLDIKNPQMFNPIHNKFFILNNNNFNNVLLNNNNKCIDIKDTISFNKYLCTILNKDKNPPTRELSVFIKFAPILDPIKYMIGKYDFNNENIFKLPLFDVSNNTLKEYDTNNTAYIDGFFCFLSSKLLNEYKFLNGIDYYGSYLANHNNMRINVFEDIDFLNESNEFHKNKNIHFNIDESFYDELSNYDSTDNKKKLNISKTSDKCSIEISDLDLKLDKLDNIQDINDNSSKIIDDSNNDIEIIDICDISFGNIRNLNSRSTSKCSSITCSSRSSHTDSESDNEENGDESDEYSRESEEEEEVEIFAYIKDFPVNIIMQEECEDTLDSYMFKDDLNENEWESILLQIIFTLIVYQKIFDFTHNDLHTNNIMYINTDKQFLYYTYNSKTYKVPTFGKIWKIIDFGRAIFKFKGKHIISDSFSPDGDASSQYNFEPYYNKNKALVPPNKSFDLCRLACSLFDYFINCNIKLIKNRDSCDNLQCLILEWCEDDNKKNILYKNNGEERYPEFKLYKMIARTVHNHTPEKQLHRLMFDKYRVSKKKLSKKVKIMNIDDYPSSS